ncbi:hypothetical protein GCM10009773_18920 [Williamsia serinedens]
MGGKTLRVAVAGVNELASAIAPDAPCSALLSSASATAGGEGTGIPAGLSGDPA